MNGEGPAERAAKKSRELTEGDDLLRGRAEQELRGFYAIAFGASLWAWDVAFTLGTHRTLFYYRRHELFVLSLVVLLSVLLLRRVHTHLWVLLFFLPSIALVLLRLVVPHPHEAVAQTADRVLSIASIAVAPFIAGIVARLLAPDYFTLPGRRLKLAVAAIVATVALIGFLIGHFNDRFAIHT